jgi:peroxiredoxin Q/BCP
MPPACSLLSRGRPSSTQEVAGRGIDSQKLSELPCTLHLRGEDSIRGITGRKAPGKGLRGPAALYAGLPNRETGKKMSDTNTDPLIGAKAPGFCLPSAEGNEVCLDSYRGKWVVVYFYPKDNTPGCTLEAKGFTDELDEFSRLDAVILGISPDSEESHRRFMEKQRLKIMLLSDTGHNVLESFGVWKKKKMMGREFSGVERSTFLIDPEGTVVAAWRKVKVLGHVANVREELEKRAGS